MLWDGGLDYAFIPYKDIGTNDEEGWENAHVVAELANGLHLLAVKRSPDSPYFKQSAEALKLQRVVSRDLGLRPPEKILIKQFLFELFWRILGVWAVHSEYRCHEKDQKELRTLLSGGVQQVRVVLRALALLQLAEDAQCAADRQGDPLTPQAIRKVGHRYQQGGLDGALMRSSGPAQPKCWTTARSSGSSPWYAAIRQRAAPAGPSDWWPKKP